MTQIQHPEKYPHKISPKTTSLQHMSHYPVPDKVKCLIEKKLLSTACHETFLIDLTVV